MSKKIDVLSLKGEKVKDIKLEDNIFNIEPNDAVIKDAVVAAMAGARQGTAKVKTRSEVAGGGRKPYRQKGTGNARQGSIRAPHYRHGGIVFGPVPRDYSKKMNKKEKKLALKSALSYKVLDKELIVVSTIEFETNKTKEMVNLLEGLNLTNHKVLVCVKELTDNVCLAARNLANVKVVLPSEINTFDLISSDNLLIEEEALTMLEEVLK
ncbi:MAG: 50S ribosomal protein L4 [Firmicutes bacterium]|nr:50S ribosomal protein L4 [Bacillota bacterium]MDY5335887.1 50S ribosomal protein L4 [Bacilli bacterium]CDE39258.1 50S ribosomal protein L4 [Firmicutes bacterium CAG:321]